VGGWVRPETESSSTLCPHLLSQPNTTVATITHNFQPTPPLTPTTANHHCRFFVFLPHLGGGWVGQSQMWINPHFFNPSLRNDFLYESYINTDKIYNM